MSKTVWFVEQGEYSDYNVVGVYSSEENATKALEYLEKFERTYDKASIREVLLDPLMEELQQGLTQFDVRILNNEVKSCRIVVNLDPEGHKDSHGERWGSHYYVWAEDETAAIKVAAERDAQWLYELRNWAAAPTSKATPR